MERADQNTLDELLNDYCSESKEYVVSKWIVERLPVIFNGDEVLYLHTKLKIAELLDVDSCSVVFVGSSCTGFSLNPRKNCKKFDDKSDIDIAIISHYHFTEAWHWLRSQNIALLRGDVKKGYQKHRSFYIFDGTIATDQILSFLPFGHIWQEATKELEKMTIFKNREIHFRLYQDHKSLIDYHINNINKNLPELLGVSPMEIKL